MLHKTLTLWRWSRNLTPVLILGALVACGGGGGGEGAGGGGGGGGETVVQPTSISGQVLKGPTQGATVGMHALAADGSKTSLGTATSDAQGNYTLRVPLISGRVYLVEATGGRYVNEITGTTEPLVGRLRAVFVANGADERVALSALSEAVALDLEQSGNWTAAAVAAANARASVAFDIPSVTAMRFIDLSRQDVILNPSEQNDVAFSLHVGTFAGFWQELQTRYPGASLQQATRTFHAAMLLDDIEQESQAMLLAGVVRYIERLPDLSLRSQFYLAAGLPDGTQSSVFEGAQTSGQSSATLPDRTLRYLSRWPTTGTSTTDTHFDKRGALLAYRVGDASAGRGLSHVGAASVADVYGDGEVAIGRWNRGYYYPSGVKTGSVAGTFDFESSDARLTALPANLVHAAGIPASNLPSCATVRMAPHAQTQAYRTRTGRTLVLDASSRIAFHHANGQSYVAYTLVLRDDQGRQYVLTDPASGGVNYPWSGRLLEATKEFGAQASDGRFEAGGEFLYVRGMLAGNGGTKAIVGFASSLGPEASTGELAAVFLQEGTSQSCSTAGNFNPGAVTAVPPAGDYYFMPRDFLVGLPLGFFDNGTPYPLNSEITAASGVEKSGNALAGIGILLPPFTFSGATVTEPVTYAYLTASSGPFPTTGSARYRLVSSTPVLTRRAGQPTAMSRSITTATLTIWFGESPRGTPNANAGTCELSIEGRAVQLPNNTYSPISGTCGFHPEMFFAGGITPGAARYAVIKYIEGFNTSEASMLFERID
jgi:hypothetical protein